MEELQVAGQIRRRTVQKLYSMLIETRDVRTETG